MAVPAAQQAHALWLRLEGDDARVQPGQGPEAVTHVGADIEAEVAGTDELGVEASQGAVAQRDAVVHEDRA
jgi:hypothetical protein